jgi:hypothetical protein
MKKLLSAFVLIALFYGTPLMAQQDAIVTQYMFNGIYYNPAVAGLDGVGKFSLLHRSQWAGGGETSPQRARIDLETRLDKFFLMVRKAEFDDFCCFTVVSPGFLLPLRLGRWRCC